MGDGLWIIVLEMVLVLAMGGLIVWWTMGGRRKDDERADRPSDKRDE